MKDLIKRITANHEWTPSHPQTESALAEFENNRSCVLSDEMKEFYRAFGEVRLFDSSYKFLPLAEIGSVGVLQAGEDGQGWCSPFWMAFCDMWDSDYVSLDLETSNILDCDHNLLGESAIIAKSFYEFVERALDSAVHPYWMNEDFSDYGIASHEPTPEFYRNLDRDWWESLGSETGSEGCKAVGCSRARIKLSVMCRRHHYEMVHKRACPFED